MITDFFNIRKKRKEQKVQEAITEYKHALWGNHRISAVEEKKLLSIAKEYPEYIAPMLDQLVQETLATGHRESALRTATDLFLDCPEWEKYTKPCLEKIRKDVDEYNEVAYSKKAKYKAKIDIPQDREGYPQYPPYPEPIKCYREDEVSKRLGLPITELLQKALIEYHDYRTYEADKILFSIAKEHPEYRDTIAKMQVQRAIDEFKLECNSALNTYLKDFNTEKKQYLLSVAAEYPEYKEPIVQKVLKEMDSNEKVPDCSEVLGKLCENDRKTTVKVAHMLLDTPNTKQPYAQLMCLAKLTETYPEIAKETLPYCKQLLDREDRNTDSCKLLSQFDSLLRKNPKLAPEVAPVLDQVFKETLSTGHRKTALQTATDLFLDHPELEQYTKPWLEETRKNVDEYNKVARKQKAEFKPKVIIPQDPSSVSQPYVTEYQGPEPIEIYKEKAVKERFGTSVSQTNVSNKISQNKGQKAQTESAQKAIMMKQSQNGGK